MRWEPDRTVPAPAYPSVPFSTGAWRGARGLCPICGVGRLFSGYLSIVPACANCGAPLGNLRADDAPPYFTIFIAGHLLLPGVLWTENHYHPPMWLHMVVWLPLFAIVCTLLLRPIKGVVVAWLLRLGFTGAEHGGAEYELAAPAEPAPVGPLPVGPLPAATVARPDA